ncbi:efflux RND transporter periplasmic adaptor subunit [Flavitalea flava]
MNEDRSIYFKCRIKLTSLLKGLPILFKNRLILGSFIAVLSSCGQGSGNSSGPAAGSKGSETEAASEASSGATPVTVTTVSQESLSDSIELNAVSAFLQKSYVKANANGYLQTANVYPGKYVDAGQALFTLKTKEAQSIGNSITLLDSTLKFSGLNRILAGQHGYITQLNHQSGDYVQDGEQLAVISDRNSFVFLLDLPYELRPYVLNKKEVELTLPDGQKLKGALGAVMPTVDSVSQTQNVMIRVNTTQAIPENLVAKVRILKVVREKTQSLPKAAILTDETESNFWVMKMTDSTTAVKTNIKKGMETRGRVEILSPVFLSSDRILLTGNYGLPDTAKVKIEGAL